jgi:hypothetical protein
VILKIQQIMDNFLVDFKRIYTKVKNKPPYYVNGTTIKIF